MSEAGAFEPLVIRRPGDGRLLGEVPGTPPEGVAQEVARVREVQKGWATLSPADRVRRMAGLREAVEKASDEIVDRIVAETGKPEGEALAEVAVVLGLMRYNERVAPEILGPRRVSVRWLFPRRSWVEREPWGVIGVIAPWNYPFILAMEPVVTALVGGNGVVLKPSEHTPFTGAFIPELLERGGLPRDLVRVIQGGGEVGSALVRGGVDRLHFTGSPATGRRILAMAAPLLLPVSLELGGKDPALVLEDADLDRAARGVVFGAFFNAGQSCIALERVFVVDEIHDTFVRKVVEVVRSLRVGGVGEVDVGPIVVPAQLDTLERQVADAVTRGAEILCGGGPPDPASNLFLPTVITGVTGEMLLSTEETFGPILPITRVRDEDEAVELANAGGFGLFASVWTGNPRRGVEIARRLGGGGVSVNDTHTHWSVPGLPLGGTGESGYSRVHGEDGLREFTRPRAYLVNGRPLSRDPWWYPYSERSRRIIRALVRLEGRTGVRRFTGALGALFRRDS